MKRRGEISGEMNDLLRLTASKDASVSSPATAKLLEALSHAVMKIVALETPVREGIMSGDLVSELFEEIRYKNSGSVEIPLDLIVPGTEHEFNGYAIPTHGRPASRLIEADYVRVPTYMIGNVMGWTEKIAENAEWDIVGRALEVAAMGLVKKKNDDGFHTIIGAGAARNAVIYDASANQGQFSTRLVSLMQTYMRRNGGGNTSSINRFKLTHLYVSPEAIESMRAWGLDQIDEITRREIYVMNDAINRVYNTNIVDIDELGIGQEYQLYYTSDLSGSLAASGGAHGHNDVELVIGIDRSRNNSLIMPTVGTRRMLEDVTAPFELRRRYRWVEELGFACLDNRVVLLGSF